MLHDWFIIFVSISVYTARYCCRYYMEAELVSDTLFMLLCSGKLHYLRGHEMIN